MISKISEVVLQLTRKCDQCCPHCFFNSSPNNNEMLTLDQIDKGLSDLKSIKLQSIDTFIISGGEPTLHPEIKTIIKKIRSAFSSSKIRLDTNGLSFMKNPELYHLLNVDIYDISVDTFHNKGIVKDGRTNDIFVSKDGSSTILEFFLKYQNIYKFNLNVRWTSNRGDYKLFNLFLSKYKNNQVTIEKKFVTATGRAKHLPKYMAGRGYVLKNNPKNFKCLMGRSLILSIDGYWYGCYHPVSFSKLTKPGNPRIFKQRLIKLLGSNLCRKLSEGGMLMVLESRKNNEATRKIMDNIINKRYWYRCQPCEEVCKKISLKA